MEHTDNAYNSIQHYFNALEQMGSYDQKETADLLIYLFVVNEIFEGGLGQYLDDKGLAVFNKLLRCLYKGCLIDSIGNFSNIKEPHLDVYSIKVRSTEDDLSRFSENNRTRIPE